MQVLVLTKNEIEQLISMNEVMQAVEVAFKEKGLGFAQMPPKIYLSYSKYNGDLRAMPSYLERLNISAVKVVNSHSENPSKYNLPSVMATIVLIDPQNGAPLAIMDGTWITAMRTGAAGGLAAKYLARKGSKKVGLVGAGAQAKTQLLALMTLYGKLDLVKVWSRTRELRENFVYEARMTYKDLSQIIAVENIEDATKEVDILVTTTPSRTPLVFDKWISEGTHINCIGADAPGKEELDPNILKRAKIVVDDWEQASHSGEINVPLSQGIISKNDIWGDICEIAAGLKHGRTSESEITVFTSTGLAIQDAVTAKLAYDKALSKKIGQTIEMF
ncbi:MAG: alanine dehydrogenase [Candidatus Bathyarchaeia archaeon]|nr:alanine dehydrogenase [Candidatus Bathyarchaeota archaeon]